MSKCHSFDILISNQCNMHCDFCCLRKLGWVKDNPSSSSEDIVNDTLIKQAIYDNFDFEVDSRNTQSDIHFSGEPFFNKESLKLMHDIIFNIMLYNRIGRLIDFKYSFTTNLTMPRKVLMDKNADDIFKLCNNYWIRMSTSFDIGGYRFKRVSELVRWYHNLKYLLEKYASFGIKINVFIILTNKVIDKGLDAFERFFDKINNKFDRVVITYTLIPYISYKGDDYKYIDTKSSKYKKFMNQLIKEAKVIKALSTASGFINNLFHKYKSDEISIEDKLFRYNETQKLIARGVFANCQYGKDMKCITNQGKAIDTGCFLNKTCWIEYPFINRSCFDNGFSINSYGITMDCLNCAKLRENFHCHNGRCPMIKNCPFNTEEND